jgi:undecaprenyl-diphosphatase
VPSIMPTEAVAPGSHAVVLAASHTVHLHLSWFQTVLLGVLQGVSELFPVSSLGHVVLLPSLFGWHQVVNVQSDPESTWLAFVVMLHVGSALGLLVYFWRDWIVLIRAWFRTLATRRIASPDERLAWLIVVASIPAGVLGLAFEHQFRVALAKPEAAALFLMLNGLILLAGERYRRRAEVRALAVREGMKEDGGRRLETMEWPEAGIIGVAQSSALIAGISREGVCMTTGLVRGLDHEDSARFAFLMATPIILAAGLFKLSDLTGPLGAGVRSQAVVAMVVTGITALLSVRFLMRYFKTRTLTPFGLYCLGFGAFMAIYIAA